VRCYNALLYILYLPLQFIAETVWAVWLSSRRYSGPKIRDPSMVRRRRLSVDMKSNVRGGLRAAKEQDRCLFFTRLPLEIRQETYTLVLGNRMLNIEVGRTGPWKMEGRLPFRRHAYMQCTSSDDPDSTYPRDIAAAKMWPYSRGLMDTMLVCRRMYVYTLPQTSV
jgi:hypothetical protein